MVRKTNASSQLRSHEKRKKESLSFPCERSVSCACPGGKRFKMQLAFAKGKKNQPVEANLHEREEKRKTKNRYR